MPFEVHTEDDLGQVEAEALKRGAAVNGSAPQSSAAPKLLTVEQVKKLRSPAAAMLVEKLVTLPGLTLVNAPGKTGKTLLAAQIGMSVAAGVPVFDYYRILQPGPVLFVEKDDPSLNSSPHEMTITDPTHSLSRKAPPSGVRQRSAACYGLEAVGSVDF